MKKTYYVYMCHDRLRFYFYHEPPEHCPYWRFSDRDVARKFINDYNKQQDKIDAQFITGVITGKRKGKPVYWDSELKRFETDNKKVYELKLTTEVTHQEVRKYLPKGILCYGQVVDEVFYLQHHQIVKSCCQHLKHKVNHLCTQHGLNCTDTPVFHKLGKFWINSIGASYGIDFCPYCGFNLLKL